MKEQSKIEFVSILQEEEFVNRVKEALVSDSEMANLFSQYSDQGDTLRYAIEFVRQTQTDLKELDQNDYNRILARIHDFSETKRNTITRRLLINNKLWKAAAIFVVIASTSFGIYQYYKPDQLTLFAQKEVPKTNEAVIILSDGSHHKLGANDDLIEYSNNGSEVTVKNKQSSEEKLDNKVKSDEIAVNQIVVPFGQRHVVKLSDGTLVHLNAGSKLVFPAEFKEKTREVYLKGEGYFEVEKNPAKPFIVKTDFIDIKVFGTSFNVSAYSDDQTVSAVLVEGNVHVVQKNKAFHNSEYTLQPGQGCFYSVKNRNASVKEVDPADYILWKDGLYQFHNQPLADIIDRVKRYYNISVLIDNDKLANTIISGKLVFTDEGEEVIAYLAKTLETRYEIKDQSIFILK